MGCVAVGPPALDLKREQFSSTLAWLWSTRRHAGVKEKF
jgi:hypothetical protein